MAGVGRALVRHVLSRIHPPADLSVVTFGEDVLGGEPARKFYLSLGFYPAELAPSMPGYGARQVFRLDLC
jgi:hypothetical protein